MKVIISGGGTGGHLYPALAIGREYAKKGAEVIYIGSAYGIEKNIMPKEEFPYHLLPVRGFGSKNPFVLAKNSFMLQHSFHMAKKLVAQIKPDLVVGTGGYASFPVLRAAQALGAKTLLHEANAQMGKANRKLSALASCVCLTYAETGEGVRCGGKVLVTGMPVRDSIKTASREEGGAYLGIDDDTLLVTVTGGSQGAHRINISMAEFYKTYAPEKKVLFYHIVGKRNVADGAEMNYPFVKVKDYEDHMDAVLARTDICIGRAGASFLAEIAIRGVASILVPYPYSGGHQEKNAAYYDRCGAAKMVLNGDAQEKLGPTLQTLIDDEALRASLGARMAEEAKADALDDIVNAGLEVMA